MIGFNETPSFYDSNEKFIKYLGQTSYYKMLQNCVNKIINVVKPNNILELGFGTGATSMMLAEENKNCKITSVDIREEMKTLAEKNANDIGLKNIEFITEDMLDYINNAAKVPEMMFLLYSFHHIEDPLIKKEEFLKKCFLKMPTGGRLCIAETFLPESINIAHEKSETKKLWGERIFEAYSSTFWASLSGLSEEEIAFSKDVARYSLDNEERAGELVYNRDNEYLVTMNWLTQKAIEIGYIVEISEYCNSIGDGVVLLKKAG